MHTLVPSSWWPTGTRPCTLQHSASTSCCVHLTDTLEGVTKRTHYTLHPMYTRGTHWFNHWIFQDVVTDLNVQGSMWAQPSLLVARPVHSDHVHLHAHACAQAKHTTHTHAHAHTQTPQWRRVASSCACKTGFVKCLLPVLRKAYVAETSCN